MLTNTHGIRILGAALIWGALCTYWYMCTIKGVCTNTQGVPIASTLTPSLTPQETWDSVAKDPLIVYFGAQGDTILTADVDVTLKNIAEYMKEHPTAQIAITGHTNIHKDDAFTIQLGKSRAEKIRELLVSYGASSTAIFTYSRGQYVLAAPATTAENQALNRRAVVSIIHN